MRTAAFLRYASGILLIACLTSLMLFPGFAFCGDKSQGAQPVQFSRNQDIAQIKPRKPVRIKLHRSAKGEYQWDISGDNADDVVRADRRLRKLLEIE